MPVKPLETKEQIESIMSDMVKQRSVSPEDYNQFYLNEKHRGKGIEFEGYEINYLTVCPDDSIYLGRLTM